MVSHLALDAVEDGDTVRRVSGEPVLWVILARSEFGNAIRDLPDVSPLVDLLPPSSTAPPHSTVVPHVLAGRRLVGIHITVRMVLARKMGRDPVL